jgi:large subunit ribosomal protein L15
MQLHELSPKTKRRGIKRIGRGGKRGTYSGRGQKGQHSRSGRKIQPAEMNVISKIPKLRGIKNKPKSVVVFETNVGYLSSIFKNTKTINKKVLLDMGLIKRMRDNAKILGNGEVKQAFTIEGIAVSKQAEEKIKAAGGTVTK